MDLPNGIFYSSDKLHVASLHLQCDPRFYIRNMKQKYLKLPSFTQKC